MDAIHAILGKSESWIETFMDEDTKEIVEIEREEIRRYYLSKLTVSMPDNYSPKLTKREQKLMWEAVVEYSRQNPERNTRVVFVKMIPKDIYDMINYQVFIRRGGTVRERAGYG